METVIVKYNKSSNYCNCCDQEIKNPKELAREFKFTKKTCLGWLNKEQWETSATCEEELLEVVNDFCYETISFFATSSHEAITIKSEEIEKVKQLILSEVISS